MPTTKLIYIDTSSLMHARHYLATATAPKEHYPQGVRAGETVVKALEKCRKLKSLVSVTTSYFAKFEMNQHYRKWNAKKVFLELGIPLETVDGRERDVFGSLGGLPDAAKENFKNKMDDNDKWFDTWEYHDVVDLDITNSRIFEIADPLQYMEPKFTLIDCLHVATALELGATYFVTCDSDLAKECNNIHRKLKQVGTLPNGEVYSPEISALSANQFLDVVSSRKKLEAT